MPNTVPVSVEDLRWFIGGIMGLVTVLLTLLTTLLASSINRNIDAVGKRMDVLEQKIPDHIRDLNKKFDETGRQLMDLTEASITVGERVPVNLKETLAKIQDRIPADLKETLASLKAGVPDNLAQTLLQLQISIAHLTKQLEAQDVSRQGKSAGAGD